MGNGYIFLDEKEGDVFWKLAELCSTLQLLKRSTSEPVLKVSESPENGFGCQLQIRRSLHSPPGEQGQKADEGENRVQNPKECHEHPLFQSKFCHHWKNNF